MNTWPLSSDGAAGEDACRLGWPARRAGCSTARADRAAARRSGRRHRRVGSARRPEPLAVDDGVARRVMDGRAGAARRQEPGAHPLRGAAHLLRLARVGADGLDAQQLAELLEVALAVLLDEGGGAHSTPPGCGCYARRWRVQGEASSPRHESIARKAGERQPLRLGHRSCRPSQRWSPSAQPPPTTRSRHSAAPGLRRPAQWRSFFRSTLPRISPRNASGPTRIPLDERQAVPSPAHKNPESGTRPGRERNRIAQPPRPIPGRRRAPCPPERPSRRPG